MPTQAELDVLNDASRKRQQARRGIEQPVEQQQTKEQEPYVNPYGSQYGTDSIQDQEYYDNYHNDDGNSNDDYVNPYRSQYGTDSIGKKEPRIGDEVNFDEISVPGSNDDTQGVPDGRAYNDILFWNSEWSTLSPLASPGSAQNLQIINGDLGWREFVGVPAGVSNNDILRFNGTNWVVQDAPASSTDPLALTIENGSMSWEETSVSGFTEETIDYVTSGNTPGSKIFLTKEVPV